MTHILTENIKSIPHLEHLPIDDFLDVIENLDRYIVSEKVDGASLVVGIDENGLYTSYGKQTDNKKYNESEYEIKFSTIYRRTAHLALEQIETILKKHLKKGDEVALEVIFGKYPNVVPYSSNINTIVFLHNKKGTTDLNKLADVLQDKTVQVKTTVPMTVDGITTQYVKNTYAYQFDEVPSAQLSDELLTYINNAIYTPVKNLKRFLAQNSGILDLTVREVLLYNLRKKPENLSKSSWPATKEKIKKAREDFNNQLKNEYYLPIKQRLLQILIHSNASRFGSEEDWIEGVVLRHPFNNVITKLVDRELFLGAKEFLWDIREKLFSLSFGLNGSTSFRSRLLGQVGETIGLPELGTVQANKKLKSMGDNKQEIVHLLKRKIDRNTNKKLLMIVKRNRERLENFLNSYLSRYMSLNKEIKGRQFEYSGEIHNRTLQVFADMFSELNRLEKVAKESTTREDFVLNILKPNLDMIGVR